MINYDKNMSHSDYLKAGGLSNGQLQMLGRSPADFIWSKNAPSDPRKAGTADFGTALHLALLEPEIFNESVLVSSMKARASQGFTKEVMENPELTVLTEIEAEQIRIMQASAMAHPIFAKIIANKYPTEVSIFAGDRKIRPDIDGAKDGFIGDVKSTASLDDWRSPLPWKNPIHCHGYGHTAAFYLDVASEFYDREINVYKFLVIQKTIDLGRYPVSVFNVDRAYLEREGFFDQMRENLEVYNKCKSGNNFAYEEIFPDFAKSEDVEISFE